MISKVVQLCHKCLQNFPIDHQETWLLRLINIVINGWMEAQHGLSGGAELYCWSPRNLIVKSDQHCYKWLEGSTIWLSGGIIVFVIQTLGRVLCKDSFWNGSIQRLPRKPIHDKLMMINLVGSFTCHYGISFAQLGFNESPTGSVSFPDVGIAS